MNNTEWKPDILDGFEAKTIALPAEDDGELVFTVIRRLSIIATSSRCVVYVHGWSDYFFQTHLADAYLAKGIDFYAVDLRRCGRSNRDGNRRNYVDDIGDYGAELAEVIRLATVDGHDRVILHGHSMGGLVSCIFAARHQGASNIALLILNSPWLDVKLPLFRRIIWWITKHFGHRFAHKEIKGDITSYVDSIHSDYRGEWTFDLAWKPREGEVVYPGWAQAVALAQAELHQGLGIEVPVLVQHSDRSTANDEWHDDLMITDSVLDIAQIHRWSSSIGPNVTVQTIPNGMHDLVLSAEPGRAQMLQQLFAWVDAHT